jgi:hypothetical protein
MQRLERRPRPAAIDVDADRLDNQLPEQLG